MTAKHVSKSQFKAKALKLFREIETSGEFVIVTEKGRPVIEVRRYKNDRRDPLEKLRGSVVEYTDPLESVGEGDWKSLS